MDEKEALEKIKKIVFAKRPALEGAPGHDHLRLILQDLTDELERHFLVAIANAVEAGADEMVHHIYKPED